MKRRDSGFALLLVFMMAAAIAITLYMQIPRVAFQAQRQKEQLLIERGEQYQRAIQLFVRTNNRYPGDLKDLEKLNNRRFLRHKFIDPMTGKDDWRLVHINNGTLADSLLNKQKAGDSKQQVPSTANTYVSELPAIGSTLDQAQQNVNSALTRRRPSEGGGVIGGDGQPIAPGRLFSGEAQGPAYPGGPGFQGAVGTVPFPGAPVPRSIGPQEVPGTPTQNSGPDYSRVLTPAEIEAVRYSGLSPTPTETPGQYASAQLAMGQTPTRGYPTQTSLPTFPGTPPVPAGSSAGAPLPSEPVNTARGFNPVGLQIPGRAVSTPGIPAAPGQTPVSSYVGVGQAYVGSSQPYVEGGLPVGSQAGTVPPASVVPNNYSNQFTTAPPYSQPPGFPAPVPPTGTPSSATSTTDAGSPLNSGGAQFTNAVAPGTPLPNAAGTKLNSVLAAPRPVGAAPMGQPGPGAIGGQQIGGGIAGVASKSESTSIMVYKDRTNYNEWEFIYDYTKQGASPGLPGGVVGTPAANLGTAPSGLGASPSTLSTAASSLASPTTNSSGGDVNGFAGASQVGMPGGAASVPGANPVSLTPGQSLKTQGAGRQSLPTNLRPGRP